MKKNDVISVALGAVMAMGSSLASAQQLGGAIAQKWWELGSENSVVGRPVSNEIWVPGGGRVSCFERGAIAWHPQTGAWSIYGDIFQASEFSEICRRGNADHLAELGEANVFMFPVGEEYTSGGSLADADCPRGYRAQQTFPLFGPKAWCWNPANRQVTATGGKFPL